MAARKHTKTVSAKLPATLIDDLDRIADYRGVTRSFLLRELVVAAVEGRVIFSLPARGRTLAELAASDVGAAARRRAQLGVEAALDGGAATADLDAPALNPDAIARRAAQLLAEGK